MLGPRELSLAYRYTTLPFSFPEFGLRSPRRPLSATLRHRWYPHTSYGQKTRNRLDSGGYDLAIARALACMLPTPSRILNAD
jgi:hypothetical protein